MSSELAKKNKKPFSWSYALAFIVGIFSLSSFFGGYEYFESGETLMGVINLVASIGLFIAAMLFMSFRIYSEEKERDNLRTRLELFEWFYSLKGKFRG